MSDTIPRRVCVFKMTPEELAIRDARIAVEDMGGDERLTNAVILLGKAQDAVADYVDGCLPQGSDDHANSIESCVRAIWDDLCTRSGIGDVLDELDDETRQEIQDSWREHIRDTANVKPASKGAKQ